MELAGFRILPGWLDRDRQAEIVEAIAGVIAQAPLYRPTVPRSGRPMSVAMTNCGELGWFTDRSGYRYEPRHPVTGRPWPPMPDILMQLWDEVAGYPVRPEACLVNYYAAAARMGTHRDEDEDDLAAPVVSVSLGDDCRFRIGGLARRDPTRSLRLRSGDVVVLGGDARLAFHGVDRIMPGSSTLLALRPDLFPGGGRVNLTLRRVRQG
jgi:alkylated DNA repair protein (DNA oxidative demethylase)